MCVKIKAVSSNVLSFGFCETTQQAFCSGHVDHIKSPSMRRPGVRLAEKLLVDVRQCSSRLRICKSPVTFSLASEHVAMGLKCVSRNT